MSGIDTGRPQDRGVSEIPSKQRAWHVVKRGKPSEALVLASDVPVPSKLAEGEVLVKVRAAALNPVGFKIMQLAPGFIARKPYVPEHDLAGVVVESNDPAFSNGDNVYGIIHVQLNLKTRLGALSQYTRVPACNLVLKPENLSAVDVAGIPLAALTAYQALFDIAHLESEQCLLVNGGSSAVGAFAIQMAKAKGCKVTATASAKNEEFVRGLGADEFLDYTKAPLESQLSENPPSPKFHVIFDAVGLLEPSLYTKSPAYTTADGIYVSTGPQPKALNAREMKTTAKMMWEVFLRPRWLGGTKRKWRVVSMNPKKQDLDAIAQMVSEGKVRPLIDSVFSFQDALKAYEKLKTGRAKGKVVVEVDDSVDVNG
ncbi:NAD P-binding protein [Gloeophyllum trabeum ATCC 11539]|uniref:NAD P-binding protein n=1 Tax=Gloeophyllum trabeum (strain ATCC 11539 / FP-39264 / Madison 617) TaxID=670483 RepID=S7QGT3_GLOTA|nr:NAD P-binding protein [Gloeophyllum trabeum ATCC 11539]EPQ58438.1 NAD P-binding protein [Gloeophyllum trabeum ATCC 11539]